jgi:hypothetical protein
MKGTDRLVAVVMVLVLTGLGAWIGAAAWAGAAGEPSVGPLRHSASLRPLPAEVERLSPVVSARRLGDLAYHQHLERLGIPPTYDFLQPLVGAPPAIAHLEQGVLVFPSSGVRVPIGVRSLPAGSVPLPPSILATPDARWVLAVVPYLLPPGRAVQHRVMAYSATGAPGPTFEHQPTHTLRGHADRLVAVERLVSSTGYCEGLRWSIRYYDLQAGATAEYGCAEGACGDALFVALSPGGPYLLAVEELEADPIPTLAIRLLVLGPDGRPLASGWFAHSTEAAPTAGGSCAAVDRLAAGSPVAVRRLAFAEPEMETAGWRLGFARDRGVEVWILTGVSPSVSPSLPRGPSIPQPVRP